MNIVPDITKLNSFSITDIEQVQQEEKEYLLLGTFLRTRGLCLFYYNPANRETKEATIKYSDTLHIYKMPDNRFITIDWESQKCTVDSKVIYFEALNIKSAIQRVKRFQQGFVKELCNLRVPSKEGIKFY
jgi:hypothetical protein